MNNAEFRKILVKLGACKEALDWLGEQDPATAWLAAGVSGSLEWLVPKLPTLSLLWAEYDVLRAVQMAEHYANRDELNAEYWAKRSRLFYSMFPWPVVEQALLKESVSP